MHRTNTTSERWAVVQKEKKSPRGKAREANEPNGQKKRTRSAQNAGQMKIYIFQMPLPGILGQTEERHGALLQQGSSDPQLGLNELNCINYKVIDIALAHIGHNLRKTNKKFKKYLFFRF